MRKLKISVIYLIISSVLLLVVSSCKSSLNQSFTYEIPSAIWEINDPMKFSFEINNIKKSYNLFVIVVNSEDYSTDNIWLFSQMISPKGHIFSDTLMYYIADDKGKWYGNKKGNLISNKFIYKSTIRFIEPGIYQFVMMHGMRANQLPKISEIGFVIEEAETEK